MDQYCFIKMLYLADREAYAEWGESITGDCPVSMQFGPVLSNVYNLTRGDSPAYRAEWSPFISDAQPETHRVILVRDPGTDDLSRAEMRVLNEVFEKFKGYGFSQMLKFSHALEEYDESVGQSSRPIRVEAILKAMGKTDEEISDTTRSHREDQALNLIFGVA